MQEASAPERIRFAASPLDPLAGRFTLERSLTRAPLHFPDAAAAEDAPLAAALFAVGGVRAVQIADGVVTVTRAAEVSWDGLKAPLAAAIRAALALDAPLGADGARPPVGRRSDAELRASVQTVLDRAANPAIAAHGGRVDVVDVVDGELRLRMSGGCQGCAASTATLRDGVERMVRAAVPEIVRIVDVTDHDAGLTPYYSHDSGAPASPLARAVPEGVVSLEDGRHVVDSDYLAPRLGLDVETLRVEMRAGRVLSREERGEGEDADRVRLTIRHGDRAWSALIQPDGRIVETPPSLDTESTDPERDCGPSRRRPCVSRGAAARLALGRLRPARRRARRLATAPRRPSGSRAGDYYGRGRGRRPTVPRRSGRRTCARRPAGTGFLRSRRRPRARA